MNYQPRIIKSKRRTIAIHVDEYAQVVVKVPYNVCVGDVSSMLLKYNDWIIRKQNEAKVKIKKVNEFDFELSRIPYYKKEAREILKERAEAISKEIGVKYKRIRLSSAQKRWGSCSIFGIVNLNWRLIFIPEKVRNYVVLHELVHLKHMNHSKAFWKEVEKHDPNYKESKKWLSENDFILRLG